MREKPEGDIGDERIREEQPVAAGASLLMALSMVINESLVARTFGTYSL
ncbi:hypothetical protein VQ042_24380 [Aurantimonas sp. A2-1-M11]